MSPIMRTKRKNSFSIVRNGHGHPNECFFSFCELILFHVALLKTAIVTDVTMHYIAFFLHELKEQVVSFDHFEKSHSHKFYIYMICLFSWSDSKFFFHGVLSRTVLKNFCPNNIQYFCGCTYLISKKKQNLDDSNLANRYKFD